MNYQKTFEEQVNKCFSKNDQLSQAIKYSLLPAGKLFRPNLFLSICKDLGVLNQEIYKYAFFLELHHVYTLIHDDLPAMDDDDFRRGRESLHKKYNEGLAILAGDALLHQSHVELHLINIKKELVNFINDSLGYKGLILGQVQDLYENLNTFKKIIEMHVLKTARLIQCATLGSYFFSELNTEESKNDFFEFGLNLGVNFQIEDDYDDFKNGQLDESNVFVNFKEDAEKKLVLSKNQILNQISKYNLKSTEAYLKKMNKI